MAQALSRDEKAVEGGAEVARPDTVERLFAEHNRALIRFLRTRVRSEQEARDVAQEAYVRLLQIDQPGTISFLRAYLFRTAMNIATDRMRADGVRQHAHQDPVFDEVLHEPDPERTALARQQLALAIECLRELPSKPRLAFLWHRLSDMSIPEVAERLGVTERMVRNYIVQALVHVRERMDQP
ncbi:MAG TPA: sigma-70 family RNA polymerase sigma factor [Usitatibacter sp.]|nr:sigma-70 family RNA polymerase sigma factor [Usitatibacter sp.]